MEFIQFYPLVIAQSGLPPSLIYPPYPKETRLINARDENLLKKYDIDDIGKFISTKRDRFSAIIFQEMLKGPVYMDYSRVPVSLWNKRPLSLLPKKKFDFRRMPFAISPAAHFFMGGVRTDAKGKTSLPGLFACGEVVWGLHGANRMRGNALTECLVSGMAAGRNAARYALTHPMSGSKNEPPKDFFHQGPYNTRAFHHLKRQLREIAWKYAGVARSEEGLKQGLKEIGELKAEMRKSEAAGASDIGMFEDLKSGIFTLETILEASLSRRESRGSFIREDFPKTDDKNWLGNSCAAYEEHAIHISFYNKLSLSDEDRKKASRALARSGNDKVALLL
jgi:succinate dehydrogenase/fumarate reductase flavoprotein subunit